MLIAPEESIESTVQERVRQTVRHIAAGEFREITCRAMSTSVRIVFRAAAAGIAEEFGRAAVRWIGTFEARYSRFIPESIVGQINSSTGGDWLEIDEEAETIFSLCDRMHELSRGAFDAAALPLLRLWNWKADPPKVPDESAIRSAMRLCGWAKVERSPRAIRLPLPGMGIDLGGIGKEFAVDRLIHLAQAHGIADAMIDIGQDLRVIGTPAGRDAWYIGLEEPGEPGRCWTALRVKDCAVATSGDYFRAFDRDGRRYGHIIDPRTGQPVNNGCEAVSVIAPNCVLGGVLSTAAFILGPDPGIDLIQEHGSVEACITTTKARHQTRRFSSYVPH